MKEKKAKRKGRRRDSKEVGKQEEKEADVKIVVSALTSPLFLDPDS